MVSGSSSKMASKDYLFCEGEKVLCYEPDKNKTKVLYDSKIMEIIPFNKDLNDESSNANNSKSGTEIDEDGDKTASKVRYLVHFQGWNSSWDRIVDEENILKDTSNNRELQKTLADESAALLSKSRSKSRGKVINNQTPLSTSPIIKEVINSATQDGGYSIEFTADDDDETPMDAASDNDHNGDADDSQDGSQSSAKLASADKKLKDKELNLLDAKIASDANPVIKQAEDLSTLVWTPLPAKLKDLLDADQDRIVDKKDFYQLPFEVTIFDILQQFIDAVMNGPPADLFPAMNKRSGMTRSLAHSSSRAYQDLQQLAAEFCNSVDIYINAIALTHLFYNEEEKDAYKKVLEKDKLMNNHRKSTEILGFIHLLRFLVVLPDFVKSTKTMTKSNANLIMSILDPSFYTFLVNHAVEFM